MTEKRFIRNIGGQIYDTENDKFYNEDYAGKSLEYEDDVVVLLNEQHNEIENMKSKGLKVLDFYLEKLKTTDDFQGVRDEIWIVKQVLFEMGVIE